MQSFAPGQLVGEYVGEIVEQCDLRTWQYAMLLKSGVAIDASRAGGLIRFMNHSCSPNFGLHVGFAPQPARVPSCSVPVIPERGVRAKHLSESVVRDCQ